jgi:hypothetical protein
MKMFHNILGCSAIAAAALAISASTTQAQNLLVNPGFDTGAFTANPITSAGENQGWATFGASQNDMSSSPIASPLSSPDALLAVNNPGNNWNPQGAYQIVSGINVGWTYTLSSSFLTDTGTSYGTPVAMQLGFGTFSGGSFVDLGTVEGGAGTNVNWGFGDNGSQHGAIPSQNTWYSASVSATAPAGATDAIAYLFFMDNGQITTENVYFDNSSLMAAPEPTTLALAGLSGAFTLSLIRRRKS